MSVFSQNRFKNLSAEYVEESLKLNAEEVIQVADSNEVEIPDIDDEAPVISKADTEEIKESVYIDSLLELL